MCSRGYENIMAAATSKRTRKRYVQQELFRRGGKRKGAGRAPKGTRAGSRHKKRPTIKPYHALHVVLRVVPAVAACAGVQCTRRCAMPRSSRRSARGSGSCTSASSVRISTCWLRLKTSVRLREGCRGGSDLGGEEHQYGPRRGQVSAAARPGVCRPLPCRGDHVAEACTPRVGVHTQQLAETLGRSRWTA